jgi:Spy/CpxP family protein refolding chaperone
LNKFSFLPPRPAAAAFYDTALIFRNVSEIKLACCLRGREQTGYKRSKEKLSMKMFSVTTCLLLGLAGLAAQVMTPIMPPPQPPYTQLTTFLNLTTGQLQSLEQVQQQKNQAVQSIYQQINQKQTQLNAQLTSNSPDPTQIGQLTIDIRALQQQVQQAGKPFRQPALAVLTQDQANKLAMLEQALLLQSTASQAVSLNLIDPQTGPVVFPLISLPQLTQTLQSQK